MKKYRKSISDKFYLQTKICKKALETRKGKTKQTRRCRSIPIDMQLHDSQATHDLNAKKQFYDRSIPCNANAHAPDLVPSKPV
jgi:hypothetical protein